MDKQDTWRPTHIQSLIYGYLEVKFAQGVQSHCFEWTIVLLLKEEETKVNISR